MARDYDRHRCCDHFDDCGLRRAKSPQQQQDTHAASGRNHHSGINRHIQDGGRGD